MKAILVREFGGPEVLKLEEVPTPKPAAGQVLVRIHAAGVNPYDTYMRAGTYARKPPLPYTPGSDGAGVVEEVGEGVKKVKQGDRVYTTTTLSGAYAEYALASEQQVHRLPEKIGFNQGAGVWVPYGTAYHALYHSAKAHASETILVHGASGGVGIAAVQIARGMGLTIFGNRRNPGRPGNSEAGRCAPSFRSPQGGVSRRNFESDRKSWAGHNSRNARQCESPPRHQTSRQRWTRDRDRQSRRDHHKCS